MAKPTGDNWHRVAGYSELEDREPLPVDVKGIDIAVILLDDELYAINNTCTHEFACLSDGYVEDNAIVCPIHMAEFDIVTGAALCEPAEEDLETYEITADQDDVYVRVE